MLEIEVSNRSGVAVDDEGAIELAGEVLAAEGMADGELGIVFVGADEMRALKREHLGIDEPTDVLSFPIDGASPLPASGAGAIAQSKGKQNHAAQGEENKKQQCKKDDRHR